MSNINESLNKKSILLQLLKVFLWFTVAYVTIFNEPQCYDNYLRRRYDIAPENWQVSNIKTRLFLRGRATILSVPF